MKGFYIAVWMLVASTPLLSIDIPTFAPKQWIGKMQEIKEVPKPLSNELNLFKNMQEGSMSYMTKGKEGIIDSTKQMNKAPMELMESLSPLKILDEKIPEITFKQPTIKDLEDKFIKENMEKTVLASINPSKLSPNATLNNNAAAEQPIIKLITRTAAQDLVLDDSLHMHVVYLTPANAPSFDPVLPGKPQEKAARTIMNKIDEKWYTEDTPFNEDKGHDHSACVRIANGYYAGFYNNAEYGPHLKGHPEAKVMWGKNWGGAWSEAGAENAVTEDRRILFILDISNSMNDADTFDDKNNCQRRLAVKQTITKNSEGVDYGLMYYHEKERAYQSFVSYGKAGKNLYDSLNNYACRGEGGTDMVKSAEDGKAKFGSPKPYDTIVLITDQSYQDTPLEDIRTNSKGVKVVTSRDKLFDVLDHLIRL
jgi:hypothetical protein